MARFIPTILSILALASYRQSSMLAEKEKTNFVHSVGKMLDNHYNRIRKSGLTPELKSLDNSRIFFEFRQDMPEQFPMTM